MAAHHKSDVAAVKDKRDRGIATGRGVEEWPQKSAKNKEVSFILDSGSRLLNSAPRFCAFGGTARFAFLNHPLKLFYAEDVALSINPHYEQTIDEYCDKNGEQRFQPA